MAQTYKVSGVNITSVDTYSAIYTCPSSTTSMINSLYLGNTGAGETSATIKLTDADGLGAGSSKDYHIVTNVLVPEQSTLQPLSAPLVLEENDVLYAKDVSGFLDVVVNTLEIS